MLQRSGTIHAHHTNQHETQITRITRTVRISSCNSCVESEEAFSEFRRGAASDPALLAELIELAWGTYGDDPEAVQRAVWPRSDVEWLMLAHDFLKRKHTVEAMQLFRASGGTATHERLQLLKDLFDARLFSEAYEVWTSGRAKSPGPNQSTGDFVNEGFEEDVKRESLGFNWRTPQPSERIEVSRDDGESHSGTFSLRLDFSGNSEPQSRLLSQMVIVEAGGRYHLTFVARAKDLITGGLPFAAILDAGDGQILARSKAVRENTSGWETYSVEFTAGPSANSIIVTIQREPCSSSLCPAFGSVWFDSFSCRKL